jgi:hypothetical protein
MQRQSIAGALRSTVRRLAAPGGIRAALAALAIAAAFGTVREAIASVAYDYTGANFSSFFGDSDLYTSANKVTGDFIFSNPLTGASTPGTTSPNSFNTYSSVSGSPPPFSFTLNDGKNTISSNDPNITFFGTFNTNASDQIVFANFSAHETGIFPNGFGIDMGISPSGDSGSFSKGTAIGGGGRSATAGTWSGPVSVAASGPSLYVSLSAGGKLSSDFKPTEISATLSLSMTPIPGAHPIETLPSSVTTLQAAAGLLHYDGFDWASQILENPNPLFDSTSLTPLSFPYSDPPAGGYAHQPLTAGRFPFYWKYPIAVNSDACPVSPNCMPIETDTTLNFTDIPADPRLKTSGGVVLFATELVGTLRCSPPGVGQCNSAGFEPGPDLFDFLWADNFDGTVGGVAGPWTANTIPVDPGSGTGGVVLISVDGVSAPEPSSLAIFLTALTGLLACILLGRIVLGHQFVRWRLMP